MTFFDSYPLMKTAFQRDVGIDPDVIEFRYHVKQKIGAGISELAALATKKFKVKDKNLNGYFHVSPEDRLRIRAHIGSIGVQLLQVPHLDRFVFFEKIICHSPSASDLISWGSSFDQILEDHNVDTNVCPVVIVHRLQRSGYRRSWCFVTRTAFPEYSQVPCVIRQPITNEERGKLTAGKGLLMHDFVMLRLSDFIDKLAVRGQGPLPG